MKTFVTWKRGESTTSTGESITLTITFTSFNAKEIDNLEKLFRENIKTMLTIDETVTDERRNSEAIPIEFIEKQISDLEDGAEYERIELNELGVCCHKQSAYRNLIHKWSEKEC